MPIAVYGHSCCVINKKIIAIGHRENPYNFVQIFDPEANAWTEMTSRPAANGFGHAFTFNNDVFTMTGDGYWNNKIFQLSGSAWTLVGTYTAAGSYPDGVARLVYPAPVVTSETLNC